MSKLTDVLQKAQVMLGDHELVKHLKVLEGFFADYPDDNLPPEIQEAMAKIEDLYKQTTN